jgi:hypothetical protein
MDRTPTVKYIPECPRHIGIVDQYTWAQKDTNKYMCYNGISHPIYDCKGDINYSLPLEYYPPNNDVHPQIKLVKRQHLNYRGNSLPMKENYINPGRGVPGVDHGPFGESRMPVEIKGPSNAYLFMASDMQPGYPLPNPYGRRTGSCSSCSGCV